MITGDLTLVDVAQFATPKNKEVSHGDTPKMDSLWVPPF
jgi:hypothetical protein